MERSAGAWARDIAVGVLVLAAIAAGVWRLRPQGPDERDASVSASRVKIGILELALEVYRRNVGGYPSEADGLAALLEARGKSGWTGPYLTPPAIPADPWGRPFRYTLEDGRPLLRSAGADGAWGTRDDVMNRSR